MIKKSILPVCMLLPLVFITAALIGRPTSRPTDQLPVVVWGTDEVEQADTLVVYSASWCAPCRAFKKRVLLQLASEGYDVEIRDVDPRSPISKSSVGKCRLVQVKSGQFKPRVVPTMYLFAGKTKMANGSLNTGSSLASFRQRLKKKNTEN